MGKYALPELRQPAKVGKKQILLIASGDMRISANRQCWPKQLEMEAALASAVKAAGYELVRAHSFNPEAGHGFIASQKEGMAVFADIDPNAKLIVAEAVWQYSYHVLAGLLSHHGPILTVANWSGTWPGLVGMLNLNASLTKAGRPYSTLWSEDFTDKMFVAGLNKWLVDGELKHSLRHVRPLSKLSIPAAERKLGEAAARELAVKKAILGVFDEGCMGMYNAIIQDELLNPVGVYKERLSQSALYYETTQVADDEAREVRRWMESRGMKFNVGLVDETDLTDSQILQQCKMYVAAVRIADDFGCDVIGIQYQQGLKDLLPASDLVEGTLNDSDRPPVKSRDGKRILFKDAPVPHFNEVDECAGLDALMTNRIHKAMGQPVETTLHDVRWGDWDASGSTDEFVWVFQISGSVPPSHLTGGWAGATSERQPAMYFRLGGGSIKGVCKPGEIVWSRIYVEKGKLKMDIGRGASIELPAEETQRRWSLTTSQWPMMNAVLYGTSRDQFMAKHKSNHIQVVYASSAKEADAAMFAKATMADAMGMNVSVCGTRKAGKPWA